jgi:hypothetical protein
MALINLVAVMIVKELGWTEWILLPVSLAILVGAGLITTQPSPRLAPAASPGPSGR